MTTKPELLAMAEQAGFGMQIDMRDGVATKNAFGGSVETQKLMRFAALVAAAEREECAKVADDKWVSSNALCDSKVAGEIARLIRARSAK